MTQSFDGLTPRRPIPAVNCRIVLGYHISLEASCFDLRNEFEKRENTLIVDIFGSIIPFFDRFEQEVNK